MLFLSPAIRIFVKINVLCNKVIESLTKGLLSDLLLVDFLFLI